MDLILKLKGNKLCFRTSYEVNLNKNVIKISSRSLGGKLDREGVRYQHFTLLQCTR